MIEAPSTSASDPPTLGVAVGHLLTSDRFRWHVGKSISVCGVRGMGEPKTGKCWCGCDEDTKGHFARGHDRRAQEALLGIVYGRRNTVEVLAMLGYSPSNSVTEARDRLIDAVD